MPFPTLGLTWKDRDKAETKKPHGCASKLARMSPLQACTRVKIKHTELAIVVGRQFRQMCVVIGGGAKSVQSYTTIQYGFRSDTASDCRC